MKRCARCGKDRPRAAFARDRTDPDGLRQRCRDRASDRHRTRRQALGRRVRPRGEPPEGHRLCLKCGEVEPWSARHRDATASDGSSRHREACRAVKGRAGRPKPRYGVTEAERDELIASRGGVCCISPAAPAAHVDHCHETGRVRGVLCFSRDAALGQFKDRPDAIRRAAAYVEGIAWKPTLVAPGVYQLPS
ncbi:endonuclease domain-containing protein [Streptomyces sp. NPDC015220]|uniref:endonuclease domain-containing protein n=1 Tax=Streptomyces sp. NPDC015220 TaxID=3364947 RepID=UPI0036F6A1E1